jgi:hypothetical protein
MYWQCIVKHACGMSVCPDAKHATACAVSEAQLSGTRQYRRDVITGSFQRWLEHLPPLSAEYSPESPTWNNSLAVCAIMRNENITDVREWLQYYRWA